ncbi:MAG: DUF6092 family protein [Thermoplasmatales archaeon]|nr:DUF6092 family protein [Candidatus Thermoplasmatota archaeon]MDA8055378.1 DUF6092 family protein [Thermoplasmatales archaeon]
MNSSEEKKLKDDLTLLISYIVSSARGCVEEPKSYGPFRLIDSVSRLVALMHKYGLSDKALDEMAEHIDRDKFSTMTDSKRFLAMLDEIVMKSLETVDSIIS